LKDPGALYLVASDLGITLERRSYDLSVKELYIGASDITVLTRFLGAYPIGTFSRKKGEPGRYRRIILFDGRHNATLTCWDDRAELVDELALKTGDLIRIRNGYVRQGLDGQCALNLGENGSIEKLKADAVLEPKVAGIDSTIKPISEIRPDESHFTIKGILKSTSRISHFTRKDGRAGSAHNLIVTDDSSASIRVVIWDPLEHLSGLPENSLVRMINLRSRVSNRDELELHGDQASSLEVLGTGSIKHNPANHAEDLQLLSLGMVHSDSHGTRSICMLVVDREGVHRTLVVKGEAMSVLEELSTGAVIRISLPSKAHYSVVEGNAGISVDKDRADMFEKEQFTDISKIEGGDAAVFTHGTALSKTRRSEITTRDGSALKRAEVDLGDGVGEVTLVAWGNLSSLLDGISPGNNLTVRAFHGHENGERTVLRAKTYSSIELVS
ncbi:MAG: hypothetical protein V3U25_02035, partial [Nitrososphaerales archaeon]